MRSMLLIIFVMITVTMSISGCGRSPSQEDMRVVARINNYELTVADFKEESLSDPLKPKEELLQEIIMKKILIQEAQKQNFDKERAFMREIEKYWEQALLKSLIKKKTADLSRDIAPGGEEGEKESVREALREWVGDLRRKASVKINTEVLEEIKMD